MNKKILIATIAMVLSPQVFSATVDIKSSSPNQYDCTIDELELYIMKRTENLRKDTSLSTWDDFKTVKAKAQINGTTGTSAANNSSANGDAEAEAIEKAKNSKLQKSGSASGSDEDCNLFFSDMEDIDMSGFDINLDGMFPGGALDGLTKLAKEQSEQLAASLINTLQEGFCKRLSTDYLTELGTDYLDDSLKSEYGYTTSDIKGGHFANDVVNDNLQESRGSSKAELLNILDKDLNNNRDKYIKRTLDNKLDDVQDQVLE